MLRDAGPGLIQATEEILHSIREDSRFDNIHINDICLSIANTLVGDNGKFKRSSQIAWETRDKLYLCNQVKRVLVIDFLSLLKKVI